MRAIRSILLVVTMALLLLALPASAAGQSASSDQPQGWLWYRDHLPVVHPRPKLVPHTPAVIVDGGPSHWTTAWIHAELPQLLDRAVQDPTPRNVRAYLALQKLAVDRAQAYAEAATMVTQSDPDLDENARFPTASAAAEAATARAQTGLVSALQQLAHTAGLFFFFRSDCPYCHRDLSVLRTFELVTGMKVIGVSIDGQGIDDQLFPDYLIDNGQARRLGVVATPAFYLVRPPDMSDVVEIGQGYLSLDELETRIMEQAYYRHWVNGASFDQTRIAAPMYTASATSGNPGHIDQQDIDSIEAVVATLPSSAGQ